jgi:hypothetical protein
MPLLVVLLVLKLTGVIDWSWWWVLAPLWVGPLVVSALIAGFFLIVFLHNRRVRWAMRRPLPGFPDGADFTAWRPPPWPPDPPPWPPDPPPRRPDRAS